MTFIAAMDNSGGSAGGVLDLYGQEWSEEDKDITISSRFVIYVAEAADEIVQQYEQMYSPITTPEKKKLIL